MTQITVPGTTASQTAGQNNALAAGFAAGLHIDNLEHACTSTSAPSAPSTPAAVSGGKRRSIRRRSTRRRSTRRRSTRRRLTRRRLTRRRKKMWGCGRRKKMWGCSKKS